MGMETKPGDVVVVLGCLSVPHLAKVRKKLVSPSVPDLYFGGEQDASHLRISTGWSQRTMTTRLG